MTSRYINGIIYVDKKPSNTTEDVMKDLQKYFNECIDELDTLGINYGNITDITVNYRAKSRWGQCRRVGNTFKININSDLLHDDAPEKGLKETIIHEILHTCPKCMCHTGEWKRLANLVNRYYGYNVKRCDNSYDKGMDEFYKNHEEIAIAQRPRKMEYKYEFKCTGCGQTIRRKKESKFTKYYKNYRCGICHGEFVKTNITNAANMGV